MAEKDIVSTILRYLKSVATVLPPMAADELLSMEYAENIQRQDFTVAERLEYAEKIKIIE